MSDTCSITTVIAIKVKVESYIAMASDIVITIIVIMFRIETRRNVLELLILINLTCNINRIYFENQP